MARRRTKTPLDDNLCRMLQDSGDRFFRVDDGLIVFERQQKVSIFSAQTPQIVEDSFVDVAIEPPLEYYALAEDIGLHLRKG